MGKPKLELESRKKIYEVVKEYPGLHMRAIQRKAGMEMNLVKYHLEKLKDSGIVTELEAEGYKRFFPTASPEKKIDYNDKRKLAFLRKEQPLRIVLFILNKGSYTTHKELKKEMDISASTISYHLGKLVDKDILEKLGRKYFVKNEEQITRLLMEFEPPEDIIENFMDSWEDFSL